jgi:hypothetical protein
MEIPTEREQKIKQIKTNLKEIINNLRIFYKILIASNASDERINKTKNLIRDIKKFLSDLHIGNFYLQEYNRLIQEYNILDKKILAKYLKNIIPNHKNGYDSMKLKLKEQSNNTYVDWQPFKYYLNYHLQDNFESSSIPHKKSRKELELPKSFVTGLPLPVAVASSSRNLSSSTKYIPFPIGSSSPFPIGSSSPFPVGSSSQIRLPSTNELDTQLSNAQLRNTKFLKNLRDHSEYLQLQNNENVIKLIKKLDSKNFHINHNILELKTKIFEKYYNKIINDIDETLTQTTIERFSEPIKFIRGAIIQNYKNKNLNDMIEQYKHFKQIQKLIR